MDRKKDIINIIESTEKNIKAAREISGQLDEIKIDAVTTFGGQSRSQSRRILRKMACVRSIATLTQIRN